MSCDITLSSIYRDGEPYIEYALASVLPYCDAAVLVDTGSKDRTPEIIRDMCSTHLKSGRWKLIETPWLGFGPSREIALPYIPNGWMWKNGHDEIYFSDRAESAIERLREHFWEETDYDYLYPVEITMEGSHVHSQYTWPGGMNTRSQFFRIEGDKYNYTFNNMRTNDDLGRYDKITNEFKFLGPLCGLHTTVMADPRFTAFVNDDTGPDSIHFAKCSKERLDWKTRTYRELVPTWDNETMTEPRKSHLYRGPWPQVFGKKPPEWLRRDIAKYYIDEYGSPVGYDRAMYCYYRKGDEVII